MIPEDEPCSIPGAIIGGFKATETSFDSTNSEKNVLEKMNQVLDKELDLLTIMNVKKIQKAPVVVDPQRIVPNLRQI